MDQIAALQWVHRNIAEFGGDAKNITVIGQSAGAYDTSLLMTSPQSKDLFQRAIDRKADPLLRFDSHQGSRLQDFSLRFSLPQSLEMRYTILIHSLAAYRCCRVKHRFPGCSPKL
jgi:carboxylesterase type B